MRVDDIGGQIRTFFFNVPAATENSAKDCLRFIQDALVLDKRDLRNIVSILILCDLCVKVGTHS